MYFARSGALASKLAPTPSERYPLGRRSSRFCRSELARENGLDNKCAGAIAPSSPASCLPRPLALSARQAQLTLLWERAWSRGRRQARRMYSPVPPPSPASWLPRLPSVIRSAGAAHASVGASLLARMVWTTNAPGQYRPLRQQAASHALWRYPLGRRNSRFCGSELAREDVGKHAACSSPVPPPSPASWLPKIIVRASGRRSVGRRSACSLMHRFRRPT
jgi:hypothetical protein